MKKLLVLILVFVMVPAANATLQISVHNAPRGGETWDPYDPLDTEIWLWASDILEIDIHEDTGQAMFEQHVWALIVYTGDATLTGGVALNPGGAGGVATAILGPVSDAWVSNPPGSEGYYGSTFAGFSGGPVGEYYAGFILHKEDIVHVVIELWELVDTGFPENWELTTLLDQVYVHSIPEPMTVLLLGLGGLALLRKRQA